MYCNTDNNLLIQLFEGACDVRRTELLRKMLTIKRKYEGSSKINVKGTVSKNICSRIQRDTHASGIVTILVEAFAPSVRHRIETSTEEIKVNVRETCQDGLLNFDIGSEIPNTQVLSQRPKR
ncbi:hypothetical protein AVEN_49948-1 [Araneus ventricosus]|uniref:Uncharacterized protein n=1 Tax=Araneus ventricosus TaxID=182803 RepID=A0A4Y2EES2_ARAVE|nr:hypothetical protein AVEN_49948-1 [Araneus ventricosus]